MKKMQLITAFFAIITAINISAYYDSNGIWHANIIEHAADTITGGRYSDTPKDTQARREAERKYHDTREEAQRKLQDKEKKIQRKKEDRRAMQ